MELGRYLKCPVARRNLEAQSPWVCSLSHCGFSSLALQFDDIFMTSKCQHVTNLV